MWKWLVRPSPLRRCSATVAAVDPLVVILLVAILAVFVAILVVLLLARRRARQLQKEAGARAAARPVDPFGSQDADAVQGDPRAIKPGDIVEVRGQSYGVRGTLTFREGSWSWVEHLLDDPQGRKRWLSVEEDPDLELVLWQDVPDATVTPGPSTVEFDGRRYHSKESGTARYQGVGTTGLDPQGKVRYHDYGARDGARLSFEQYGGSGTWEVGRGEVLTRAEVQIFPRTD